MSDKTSKDSASQPDRTAKTPDLIGFSTADKLSDFESNIESKEVLNQTKEVLNHPTNTLPPQTKEVLNRSKSPKLPKSNNNLKDTLKKYERSIKHHDIESAYLCIVDLLNLGIRPSEISSKSGVSKTTLQRHLNTLKKRGTVYKVGYGVWETTDNQKITKKRSTQSPYVAKEEVPSRIQEISQLSIPDSVRAHAFTFTLKVPDLRNWTNEKRVEFLESRNIPYKSLGIIGGGQRLIIDGRKTWLTNRSVVIYDTGSYFAEKAIEAKSDAVQSFFSIVKRLERLLHVELTVGSDYKFKVSRQHYALMQNALARQYNKEGDTKLEIRSEGDNSLWFLIDNSFNLNEAETVHPDTAMSDNQKVQTFFNQLKETGITPNFILEAMAGIQGNQEVFAANTESHIEAIRDLSKGTTDFTEAAKEFSGAVEELLKLIKEMSRRNNQGSAFEIITL